MENEKYYICHVDVGRWEYHYAEDTTIRGKQNAKRFYDEQVDYARKEERGDDETNFISLSEAEFDKFGVLREKDNSTVYEWNR